MIPWCSGYTEFRNGKCTNCNKPVSLPIKNFNKETTNCPRCKCVGQLEYVD